MDFQSLFKTVFLFVQFALLASCNEAGVQGGKVDFSFLGVEKVEILSPTAVKLRWTKDSQYINYRIYIQGTNSSIDTSTFSEYVVTGLTPGTSYQFSVSGVNAGDSDEVHQQTFLPATTYEEYTGLTEEGVVVLSPTRVDLSWPNAGGNASYEVSYRTSLETEWNVVDTVSATSSEIVVNPVTGLLGGTEYCFRVQANYADSTSLPTLASQPERCVTTNAGLNPVPTIYAGSSSPGNFPWFNAVGASGLGYTIEVYNELDINTPIASTNSGDGAFRSSTFLPPSKNDMFAIVRNAEGVQARVEITYSDPNNLDLSVRNFFDDAQFGAVHPPLINGGQGIQSLGAQVVSGDFNCDGLEDMAVSAPFASPVENEDLIFETGAVVIYYSYDPPIDPATAIDPDPFLNTQGEPKSNSVFPDPHLIHYPVGTSNRLGTLLQVANFNGDCFYRDNTNPIGGKCSSFYGNAANDIENIHSCDDLVLTGTSNSRQVFAIYGDPQQGLVSGSGGTNFGIDEYTCDATSSSCRSVKLNDPSDDSDRFGEALGAGDFNNDGYDDLLITAAHLDGGVASKTIYVLRGTDQGITPIGHINSFEPIATTDTSLFPAAEAPTSDDDFGISLSAMYNSRECSSSNTSFKYLSEGPSPRVGFDFTKCDDVIIGAPGRSNNRGSIYSCKATLVPISTPGDNERINGWTCAEHYPNELEVATETTTEVDPARYGFSLLSVENQNGYPLTDTQIIDGGNPDVTGALFVGAPNKTVNGVVQAGAVYGYYVTPILDNHNTGGIQAVLTEGAENGHDVNAQNSVACDATNNNCENQVLVNSPAQSFSNFGYALSHIQSVSGLNQLPHLAVSAPFRDVASVNGGTDIVNAGTIYLFGPDISTFGIDGGAQIFDTQRNGFSSGCTNNCTWYSGGVSPFGPNIIFPNGLNTHANFGIGGAVGADFNSDNFGDLYASAPNYATPIESNGGIFGFEANEGNFSSVENQVDDLINDNISNELNYRFENAKIVGDVNGDGFDDVLSKIEVGTSVDLVIYYGSASGLIKTAAPSVNAVGLNPKILFNNSDRQMGERFYKIGSVDCDAFDDILLVGSQGSYVYYGSSTGVISSAQPSPAPVGKNPLLFGRGSISNTIISLNSNSMFGRNGNVDYDTSNQSVGFGDFNGDSCSDIAVGITSSKGFTSVTNQNELNIDPTNNYSTSNNGRTLVFYGAITGLQVGDSNGFIRLSENNGSKGNVVANEPCGTTGCDIQMISSPAPSLPSGATNGDSFGYDVIGISSITEIDGEVTSELLISDPGENGNDGAVYLFLGGPNGLVNVHHQSLVPNINTHAGDGTDFSGERFGEHLASAGDINGDSFPDVIVSSPGFGNDKGHAYVFYSGKIGSDPAFLGEDTLGSRNFWGEGVPQLNVNQRFDSVNPSDIKPQIINPINVGNSDRYANGISGVGDFNTDGFADIIVNVALGDYLQEVNIEDSGMAIMYFGSDLGLQIHVEESTAPRCIYSNSPEECAPFQLFLPSRQLKERSYISNSCSGDVNGDGVSDILMGARGRHHPSGLATATGVFYIMY